jgi:hypothetical protein
MCRGRFAAFDPRPPGLGGAITIAGVKEHVPAEVVILIVCRWSEEWIKPDNSAEYFRDKRFEYGSICAKQEATLETEGCCGISGHTMGSLGKGVHTIRIGLPPERRSDCIILWHRNIHRQRLHVRGYPRRVSSILLVWRHSWMHWPCCRCWRISHRRPAHRKSAHRRSTHMRSIHMRSTHMGSTHRRSTHMRSAHRRSPLATRQWLVKSVVCCCWMLTRPWGRRHCVWGRDGLRWRPRGAIQSGISREIGRNAGDRWGIHTRQRRRGGIVRAWGVDTHCRCALHARHRWYERCSIVRSCGIVRKMHRCSWLLSPGRGGLPVVRGGDKRRLNCRLGRGQGRDERGVSPFGSVVKHCSFVSSGIYGFLRSIHHDLDGVR